MTNASEYNKSSPARPGPAHKNLVFDMTILPLRLRALKDPAERGEIDLTNLSLSLYLLRFTMASNGVTVENVSGEIPKKIVDLNVAEPDEILDGEVKESTDVSGEKKDESDSKSAGDVSPVDDVQKKIRRAERFGVSVKLTEEEKRNSRAER